MPYYSKKNSYHNNSIPNKTYKNRVPNLSEFGLDNTNLEQLNKEYDEYLLESSKFENRETALGCLAAFILIFTWCCPLAAAIEIIRIIYELSTGGFFIENGMIGYWVFLILGNIFVFYYFKNEQNGFKLNKKFNRQDEIDNLNKYHKSVKDYEWWQEQKKEDYWRKMDGRTFEIKIAELFNNIGYTAKLTQNGADGGIDIELNKDGKRIAVQCKAHKSKISEGVVRDLYGVLHAYDFDSGMLVTLNGGSSNTIGFCRSKKDKPIQILELSDILKLIKEN